MPPKKAETPKKKITKSAASPKHFTIGDIVSVKKTGVVMNAICRKHQGQNGIICGQNSNFKNIQLIFVQNDKLDMPYFPSECLTVLSEDKKKKFWNDFNYNVSLANGHNKLL